MAYVISFGMGLDGVTRSEIGRMLGLVVENLLLTLLSKISTLIESLYKRARHRENFRTAKLRLEP